MEGYRFEYQGKNYELTEDNITAFINDEENQVNGIDAAKVLELLKQAEAVEFDKSYYEEPCEECKAGLKDKAKYFDFLEYYFYIFTRNNEYVISTISKEYEGLTFNKLLRAGKVDNSYIVTVIVCKNCGSYSIEIEQCDI